MANHHSDLLAYYQKHLASLVTTYPFVLRLTEWKDYPAPILVVKERREFISDGNGKNQSLLHGATRKILLEIGHLAGAPQRRCLPIIRHLVAKVRDMADVPLELHRFLSNEGLRLRLSLPLDEEAGAKLGLIFRLQVRLKELDRVELIARRVANCSREEAAYLLSRTLRFGPDANRWAISGLRLMLGGQPGDPAVEKMLARLRISG
ncbi:DUF7680 family protein [Desulfobacca acetoxidans]